MQSANDSDSDTAETPLKPTQKVGIGKTSVGDGDGAYLEQDKENEVPHVGNNLELSKQMARPKVKGDA